MLDVQTTPAMTAPPSQMRAAVYHKYGAPEVVRVESRPTPAPAEGEVLVHVRASTVSSADVRARSLRMPRGFGPFARPAFGLFGPRKQVLGTELAGVVAAVGRGVSKFAVGDAVFAFPGFELGCHVEYRTLREDGRILPLPRGVSFEQAAAISFGGTTALHFLQRMGRLAPGEKVLVIGASGAVGSAAVQIAKLLGGEVTGVTSSGNLELVTQLGADRVIDYTTTDYLRSGERYDVIFDTVGATHYAACKGLLNSAGRLLLAAASLPEILEGAWATTMHRAKVSAGPAPERSEDLKVLRQWAEEGRFRPLIDRAYPLERIADAHAYVDRGHKRGSVIITMDTPRLA